jgi:hypothetical protein
MGIQRSVRLGGQILASGLLACGLTALPAALAGPASGQAGMKIMIDPETGQPRAPTDEERRAMRQQRANPALKKAAPEAPMRSHRRDDGVIKLEVPASRYPRLQARPNGKGGVEMRHGPAGDAHE